MAPFKRPIGVSGVALAVALVAAACGSDSAQPTTVDGAATSSAESVETTAAPSPADLSEAPDAADAAESTDTSETAAPVVEHSFPDLDTVSITDGSTVNLADELAGGDTPILLWFFAPH